MGKSVGVEKEKENFFASIEAPGTGGGWASTRAHRGAAAAGVALSYGGERPAMVSCDFDERGESLWLWPLSVRTDMANTVYRRDVIERRATSQSPPNLRWRLVSMRPGSIRSMEATAPLLPFQYGGQG